MTFYKIFKNIPFLQKSSGTRYKSDLFQKAVLSNLEWKFFFIIQPWWAVFKIGFARLFSLEKLTNHFLKVKSNPDVDVLSFFGDSPLGMLN